MKPTAQEAREIAARIGSLCDRLEELQQQIAELRWLALEPMHDQARALARELQAIENQQ